MALEWVELRWLVKAAFWTMDGEKLTDQETRSWQGQIRSGSVKVLQYRLLGPSLRSSEWMDVPEVQEVDTAIPSSEEFLEMSDVRKMPSMNAFQSPAEESPTVSDVDWRIPVRPEPFWYNQAVDMTSSGDSRAVAIGLSIVSAQLDYLIQMKERDR